jgi:hypothetical protein
MRIHFYWISVILLALVSLASASEGPFDHKIEITPFGGFGFGGDLDVVDSNDTLKIEEDSLYGFIVDFGGTPEAQYEFFFSQQATKLTSSSGLIPPETLTDLDITYAHIGGVLNFGADRVRPFFGGGLGLTHFNVENYSNDTKFSISLAGGVKLFLTKNVGFRFELRGLGTLVNNTTWIYSGSGGSAIGISGDVLLQGQLNAGLIIGF